MLNGLYSAAAGMIAQQTRIDALANDIANVNTTGYKQLRLGFRDLAYNIESGMRVGAGAALVDGGREFSSGALLQTGDPLSVALTGPGFLQVRLADGRIGLTRGGDIHLDGNGTFTLASGERLWPQITLPKGVSAGDVSISPQGVVSAKGSVVGRLSIVDVPAPSKLQPIGGSIFVPTAASGAARAAGGTRVDQGFLEASNVSLADAMVNVIDAQRSYQLDAKVISTQDQLMEIANGIRR
jgi:flagellar basal-body rod protein FlgG